MWSGSNKFDLKCACTMLWCCFILKVNFLHFLQKQLKELKIERDSMVIEEEESLKDYYNLLRQHQSLKNDVRDIVFSPKYCLPFLQPGRLVKIRLLGDDKMPSFSTEERVTWGVILNFERVKGSAEGK